MSFMEKIKHLDNSYSKLDGIVKCHLIIRHKGVSEDFLTKLKLIFPLLSKTYLDYLKLYDGLKIDWITLYGSPDSEGVSLFETLELWERTSSINLVKLGYCPIGEDAGADLYCLDEKGQVVMFDSEVYEEQEPKLIADSFESFMDECVLGKRYPEMSIEDSTFHKFLKSQGWA